MLKLLAHLKPRTGAAVWGMLLEGADLLRSIVGGDRYAPDLDAFLETVTVEAETRRSSSQVTIKTHRPENVAEA